MSNQKSVLRLIFCYAVCLLLLGNTFYGVLSIKKTESLQSEETPLFTPQYKETVSEATSSLTEQKPQEAPKEVTTSEASTSSQQASASAVKGKIVTRYISPYNAPLSYNSVYMKNSTPLYIKIKDLLNVNLKFKISKNNSPQVLIMHTHTTESYMQKEADFFTEDDTPRTTDQSKNMVKIGQIIAKKLNDAGIKTIHATEVHDYPEYTGSYSRSAETVNKYLKKYPSIKIVLDLHRDSVSAGEGNKAKLVTEINGKKAAQVMLVMGSQSGSIKNHPKWQENLKLALKIQQNLEVNYPTLARPLLLMSKSYNQPLSTGSVLIEFGTEANTLAEASYSAELVGNSLISLLNTLK